MKLTVGIATWNRASLLEESVEAVLRSDVPAGVTREIVVVDNASSDHTPEILNDLATRHGVKVGREARPGKSHALNQAATIASGDYILWIDDDIRVDPDWMVQFHAAIEAFPSAVLFGGSITPAFEGTPPRWLLEGMAEVGGVFGLCEPQAGPITLDGPMLPFGGNWAIRRDIQVRYPYNTAIGRKHGQLLAGEESDLVRQIITDGSGGRWVPEAHVRHVIPERMQNLAYIRRYYHDYGASMALSHQKEPSSRRLPSRWVIRDALQHRVLYWLRRLLRRPPEEWLRSMRFSSFALGAIRRRPAKAKRR